MKRETGLSYGLLIKKALLDQLSYDFYRKAKADGFKEAEEEFKITYPCNVCGRPIVMRPGDEDHKDAINYLNSAGWGHSTCQSSAR